MPGRPAYHHGDLRKDALRAAARRIALRQGPHFTLREIADDLDVSHPALYRHFRNKRALLDAIVVEGFATLKRNQENALAKTRGAPFTRLMLLFDEYLAFAKRKPGHFRVMFDGAVTGKQGALEVHEALRAAQGPILETIRECQQRGVIQPGDSGRIATVLWAMVHGYAQLAASGSADQIMGRGYSARAVRKTFAEILKRGLRA